MKTGSDAVDVLNEIGLGGLLAEVATDNMKDWIYANWLALERHGNARIALESLLLGYLVGHVSRTYNAFCEGKAGSTPERLRDVRGGQAPRSYPFVAVGFLKPMHANKWPGQRLVLCHYLGMRYCTGGGCLSYPFTVDNEGYRQGSLFSD